MGNPSYTETSPPVRSVDDPSVVNPGRFFATLTPYERRYLCWRALGLNRSEFLGQPYTASLVYLWKTSGLLPYQEANRNDIDDARHLLQWPTFVDLSDEPTVSILAQLDVDAHRAFTARALGPIHPSFDPHFRWTSWHENLWAACQFVRYQDPDPMGLELDRADRLLRR